MKSTKLKEAKDAKIKLAKAEAKEKKSKKERIAITQKKALVSKIASDSKGYPTVALITLRNLPDDLLQSSKKKLREENGTLIKVAKLTVIKRALESIGLKEQADQLSNPSAIIMTKHSPYALNKFFRQNRKKVAAKSGQIAPFEIIVPASDTDLPPGPALSELKAAGLNVQIKAGKIAIVKNSVVAKKGDIITGPKAKALQKLNVLPFEVGVNLVFAYDGKYVYSPEVLSIDAETLNPELMQCMRDAFSLSVNASYPSSQTIEVLLTQAFLQGSNFSINAGVYSSSSMEQLLTLAVRQGMALEGLNK